MRETFSISIPCEKEIKKLECELASKGFTLDRIEWSERLISRVHNVVAHYYRKETANERDQSPKSHHH